MIANTAQGKTILITGGAGGLGKAIATSFLEAGANVAICDINQERLDATQTEWQEKYQAADRILASQTNITDEEAVKKLVDGVVAKFGRIDMLVNNAGIMDTFDPVGSLEKTAWDRVIGVNLTGAFLCTKAAVNAIEAQKEPAGGTIISIGSVASYKGVNAGAAYTAAKHGLLGLTRNTAGYYGHKGIYSIALLLGGMEDTHIADAFMKGPFNQEGMKKIGEVNPGYVIGKTGIPLLDVAKYCLFFSDPNLAAASNGAAITVNKNWPAA